MTLKLATVCVALFLGIPAFARPKTDVIVMKNGDRMTCEIKGLDSGVLYVSVDYIDGTTSVDWLKVQHVESKQLFIVKSGDGSVYSGMIRTEDSTPGRPIQIVPLETKQGGAAINPVEITEMTQTSNKFWQRFNGEIDTGISYSKGNQSTQLNLSALVEYPRERWAARGQISSTLSANSGSPTSTRNSLDLDALRLLRWKNWYYAGLGNFLQSSEQQIQLQSNIGAGIGRYLKNTNRSTIMVTGGFAWQNTRYSQTTQSQASANLAAGLAAAQLKFFRFKKTNLTVNAIAFPATSQPGRLYFVLNTTYYVKLFGQVDWNVTFYGNWDNQPPPHFSGSNYGTTSGLSWSFGNK